MKFHILLWMALLVTACVSQLEPTSRPDPAGTSPSGNTMPTNGPFTNPFAPQRGDRDLTRGNAYVSKASLVIRESFPPQISLVPVGDLPTPCNQLRVGISSPDPEKKIIGDVYSVVDAGRICVEVLEPFEELIELGTFPTDHYTVWLNGVMAGEFDT